MNTDTASENPPAPLTLMVPPHISRVKSWRKRMDEVLQEMKAEFLPNKTRLASMDEHVNRNNAVIRLQEAIMWCGMVLKAINGAEPAASPGPYPESYNPDSAKIEPTADGLKL